MSTPFITRRQGIIGKPRIILRQQLSISSQLPKPMITMMKLRQRITLTWPMDTRFRLSTTPNWQQKKTSQLTTLMLITVTQIMSRVSTSKW